MTNSEHRPSGTRTTVLIVSYNPGPELLECVTAARELRDVNIVVWDNSDHDKARELLWEFTDIDIAGDGFNHGFGSGNNHAFAERRSDSEYLLLLNPDCVIHNNALENLIEALERRPDAAVAAPRMRYPDHSFGISGGPFPRISKEIASSLGVTRFLPKRFRTQLMRLYDQMIGRDAAGYSTALEPGDDVALDWVSGFCMLIRQRDFELVGGFSEEFFLYYEDVDLCRRFASLNRTSILVRQAEALHYESVSTSSGSGKSVHYAEGRRTYFRLHGGRMQRLVAFILLRMAMLSTGK